MKAGVHERHIQAFSLLPLLQIVKRIKVTRVVHRINKAVHERRNLPLFGIEAAEGSTGKAFTVR